MTNRIAVGTPVTVKENYSYPSHKGRNDLVVLWDNGSAYGVGPKGNNPDHYHSGATGWLGYPTNDVTPKEESKAVTKFKEGDKVRYIKKWNREWYGVEGVVKTVKANGNLIVTLTKGATGWASSYGVGSTATLNPVDLELIEEKAQEPFTFKDIQKGDTIRRTYTHATGAKETREGTVSKLGGWYVEAEGYILAYDVDDTKGAETVTLELLNRPEPVKEPVKEPTLLENTKTGDQLVIRFKHGTTKVYTKISDSGEEDWQAVVLHTSGNVSRGAQWSNTELEEFVNGEGNSHTLITK